MFRFSTLVGIGIACLALVISVDAGGGGKEKDKGEPKGMLPQGFKDLKVTNDQKKKIYAIQADYKAKIADLEKKIVELKSQSSADVFKVLTPEQQALYFKSKGIEAKDKAAPPTDKAVEKKDKATPTTDKAIEKKEKSDDKK
jgi:Spy/CpxP family protein refolding chaperone